MLSVTRVELWSNNTFKTMKLNSLSRFQPLMATTGQLHSFRYACLFLKFTSPTNGRRPDPGILSRGYCPGKR